MTWTILTHRMVSSQLLRYSTSFLISQFSTLNHEQVLEASRMCSYVHPTSELTGERTCIMLRGLDSATDGELDWTAEFVKGDYLVHLILRLLSGRFWETILDVTKFLQGQVMN